MHDLHVANKILKLIFQYAKKNKLKKVTKVEIDLGVISEHGLEIIPENLAFNIKMLAKNTLAQDLEVKVNKIKGNEWVLKNITGE